MIVRSFCALSALPTLVRAGTSAETPPRPCSPWHCEHANWTKTWPPAATVGSSVGVAAAVTAGVGAVVRSSGVPPYSETRNYVKKITNLYWSGKSGAGMFVMPSRDPVRVYRDAQGVITMTNTD